MRHSFSSLAEFALLREEFRGFLRSLCPAMSERLFVALNEAVNNALLHGTKEDSKKTVTVTVKENEGEVVISVCHDGRGLKRRTGGCGGRTGLEEGGRGLFIIRSCADSVSYNETGNELVIKAVITQ